MMEERRGGKSIETAHRNLYKIVAKFCSFRVERKMIR